MIIEATQLLSQAEINELESNMGFGHGIIVNEKLTIYRPWDKDLKSSTKSLTNLEPTDEFKTISKKIREASGNKNFSYNYFIKCIITFDNKEDLLKTPLTNAMIKFVA